MNSTKTLLLLVDGVPTPNGGGTSQTLANLLSGWQQPVFYLGSTAERQTGFDGRMEVVMRQYSVRSWQRVSNRFGRWINPWLLRRHLAWMQQVALPMHDLPAASASIVLLSTTLPEKLIVARRLQQAGYTVVPYFMDDWMAGSTLRWRGGNLQQTVQQLLQQAPAWLMISRQLEATLRRRYTLAPKPCLVIHNPAPAVRLVDDRWQMAGSAGEQELADDRWQMTEGSEDQELAVGNLQLASGNGDETPGKLLTANCQLIYAGSIWPMHADALAAVARAVQHLQAQGHTAYQLIIYTSEAHWAQYRTQLSGAGVHYGGWQPYAALPSMLQQAWLLVCTASFEEAHQAYSNSSVQTKLTDYMAAGKPVLFVGPEDAASGQFVDEHDIGFTLATTNAADIAERLLAIAALPVQYRRKCTNALREAGTTFSQAAVQERLYWFLEGVVGQAGLSSPVMPF